MLETITKLKAPESEHLLLQNCLLHMRRMCHFGILYYQAKGVVVRLTMAAELSTMPVGVGLTLKTPDLLGEVRSTRRC